MRVFLHSRMSGPSLVDSQQHKGNRHTIKQLCLGQVKMEYCPKALFSTANSVCNIEKLGIGPGDKASFCLGTFLC